MMSLLPADPVKRGRVKLLLLAAFFASPMAAAWLAYELQWAPGGSGNYGELVEPRSIPDATLVRVNDAPLKLSSLRGKWVLVQFDAPDCDAYCEKKLYYMRQIRRALGRDLERVERLWVLAGAGTPRAALLAAFEGTKVVRSADPGFATAFPVATSQADHIFVVDPLGNIMMRFPRDPDPSRMLKDLKRLLKYSQIG